MPRSSSAEQSMDKMWGEESAAAGIEYSDRAVLFRDGNYGMFIHWGLFSHLGGKWNGETFYGVVEWIKPQMNISDADYMGIAKDFNPSAFDAEEIVRTAKAAGMKWVIITAKHHDGFAMFRSSHPFNIAEASPFGRDPMHELAAACRKSGLGFGFYYSHFQDWTAPGGQGGPKINPDGSPASFEQYFQEKCFPQIKELCGNYGPLDFIWFDTPGHMPKEFVIELADYVRLAQPRALLCSRIGHGRGDYASRGDMEVPLTNGNGLWESCDTTNDSWGYTWYDQNWKDSREILHRLVSTVARGGTYLLNVGPDGTGLIPAPAAKYLKEAGLWVNRHQEVISSAGPSPWGHAMPWGDVTTAEETLNLTVFDWPQDERLFFPGLKNVIVAARLKSNGQALPVTVSQRGGWTVLRLPATPPEHPATVIGLQIKGAPEVDQTLGVHPNSVNIFPVEFAEVTGAVKRRLSWMEKFGEWKFAVQAGEWPDSGQVSWAVDVAKPGDYRADLKYKGSGRMVWAIEIEGDCKLQNQQNSSSVYQYYPLGRLHFSKPGRHTITVSLIHGDRQKASLESLRLTGTESRRDP